MSQNTDDENYSESSYLVNYGKIGSLNIAKEMRLNSDIIKKVSCGDEFTVLLTENGTAFSYGKNDWGQLGIGSFETKKSPTIIKFFQENREFVTDIACGRSHTIVSTKSFIYYGFGSNSEGQLGVDLKTAEKTQNPLDIDQLDDVEVKQLCAAGDYSALLTVQGELYMWGSNSEGQLGYDLSTRTIDENEENDGSNDIMNENSWRIHKVEFRENQHHLGDDDLDTTMTGERKMRSMKKRHHGKRRRIMVNVSCGMYHVGAVCNKGELWMWGEGTDGQLGNGDTNNQKKPMKISLSHQATERIQQVSCGGNHTLCLTDTGQIFVWGSNSSGQLGLGTRITYCPRPTNLVLPHPVTNLLQASSLDTEIATVSAGFNYSFITTKQGITLAFGDNRQTQLGFPNNEQSNVNYPLPLEVPPNCVIQSISCGGCHSTLHMTEDVNNSQPRRLPNWYSADKLLQEITNYDTGGRTRRTRRKQDVQNIDASLLPTLADDDIITSQSFEPVHSDNYNNRRASDMTMEEKVDNFSQIYDSIYGEKGLEMNKNNRKLENDENQDSLHSSDKRKYRRRAPKKVEVSEDKQDYRPNDSNSTAKIPIQNNHQPEVAKQVGCGGCQNSNTRSSSQGINKESFVADEQSSSNHHQSENSKSCEIL